MEKDSLSTNDVGVIGHPFGNKMNSASSSCPMLKWIIDLNVKYKGIKLENLGEYFWPGVKDFSDTTLKIWLIKERKGLKFLLCKRCCYKMKREAMNWKKIFANRISEKGLKSRAKNSWTHKYENKQLHWKDGPKTWTSISPKIIKGGQIHSREDIQYF